MVLTEPARAVVPLPLWLSPAGAAQPLQGDVDVGEDDEGRRQDGAVVEGHDQLVPLELPHLVGDGLHLKEGVAVEETVAIAAVSGNASDIFLLHIKASGLTESSVLLKTRN